MRATATIMAVWIRLMVDTLCHRNMCTFHRVVFPQILPDYLITLSKKRNVDLHQLIILCDAPIGLVYYVIAL